MAKSNRPTLETVSKRFHAANKVAEEAQRAHENAARNVMIAAAKYGEDSDEYKAAVEERRAALRDLKEKNKASNEAGGNLSKYMDSGNIRHDQRYKAYRPTADSVKKEYDKLESQRMTLAQDLRKLDRAAKSAHTKYEKAKITGKNLNSAKEAYEAAWKRHYAKNKELQKLNDKLNKLDSKYRKIKGYSIRDEDIPF